MGVRGNLIYLLEAWKQELASAMEYRANFIAQAIGMFANDAFWLVFWGIMFARFKSVGGWGMREIMLMNAVLALSFGLSVTLFGNARKLRRLIENGSLDYFLTLPKDVLLTSSLKMHVSGLGDIAFGLLMALLTVPLSGIPLFLLLTLFSMIILTAWFILISSLAFYAPGHAGSLGPLQESLMIFSFYPFSLYSGWTRLFLLVVIPAGFVSGIPVQLLTVFSWRWLLLTGLFSCGFLALSALFFRLGLRRYESGNQIALRG